jgi:Bacterial mobilisation protein (MobC)
VNLNQIARIANATGHAPARLETALETLEKILLREIDHDDAPAPQAAAPKPAGPRP